MTNTYPQPDTPQALTLVAQTVDLREPRKIPCKSLLLPRRLSVAGFRITGPQSELQLCLFLTLWPGAEISQSPATLHEISAAPSWGCYESNGGTMSISLLPEKLNSFVIIIIMSTIYFAPMCQALVYVLDVHSLI